MTEPVTQDAPATVAEAGAPAPKARKRGVGRVLLRVVLPSVVVLGLIGGGVTYTALTIDSADRTAPTRLWEHPAKGAQTKDPAAGPFRGRTDTALSRLLLPLPEGYVFGPDMGLYGNDGELGAAEAVALVKQAGKGLSGKKRRAFEKEVDKLGIQGIGVRSFADPAHGVIVNFRVEQVKDKKRIKNSYRLRKEVLDFLKFPKGPQVKGHKNAVCYMAPADDSLDKEERELALEEMICLGYDSEVSVTMTAAGVKPFDKARVAKLMAQQLDHIASPGEYV
ncbi:MULTISPECIES: hypothetical protein [unclassified Streptomyces]|uniref:hypothetical protein n=1 Tax=unclassified Streptomyces TaxID=2593676 RepID=UPI0019CFB447|nr:MULTISPECIES: hypothetical protein [unclassified Streptomyces]